MPATLKPREQLAEIRAEFDHLTRLEPAHIWGAWTRREPVLGSVGSLDDVLDRVSTKNPKTVRDATVLGLVRLAQDSWQREATLVVVAALQPKLWAMSRRRGQRRDLSVHRVEEQYVALQSALVEEIQAFNTSRRWEGTVACLVLNTLHRTRAVRGAERNVEWWSMSTSTPLSDRPVSRSTQIDADAVTTELATVPVRPYTPRLVHRDLVAESPEVLERSSPFNGGPPSREDDIVATLAWAVRAALVSKDDARLLYKIHVEPASAREATQARRTAAANFGVSTAAIRQRCARATRAIAEGVETAGAWNANSVQAA